MSSIEDLFREVVGRFVLENPPDTPRLGILVSALSEYSREYEAIKAEALSHGHWSELNSRENETGLDDLVYNALLHLETVPLADFWEIDKWLDILDSVINRHKSILEGICGGSERSRVMSDIKWEIDRLILFQTETKLVKEGDLQAQIDRLRYISDYIQVLEKEGGGDTDILNRMYSELSPLIRSLSEINLYRVNQAFGAYADILDTTEALLRRFKAYFSIFRSVVEVEYNLPEIAAEIENLKNAFLSEHGDFETRKVITFAAKSLTGIDSMMKDHIDNIDEDIKVHFMLVLDKLSETSIINGKKNIYEYGYMLSGLEGATAMITHSRM